MIIPVYIWMPPILHSSFNFGDVMNLDLLTHFKPDDVEFKLSEKKYSRLYCQGSILPDRPWESARSFCVIGSGLLKKQPLSLPHAKIYALRGALTRNLLGLPEDIPLGDPGILASEIYPHDLSQKRNGIGLVPHSMDRHDSRIKQLVSSFGIKVIDVENPPEQVVSEIAACSQILSSSLHGLIVADSLGIPNLWVRFSDLGNGENHEFKFHDYFSSIGRTGSSAQAFAPETTIPNLPNNIPYSKGIDTCKISLKNAFSSFFHDLKSKNIPFNMESTSMDISQYKPWFSLKISEFIKYHTPFRSHS